MRRLFLLFVSAFMVMILAAPPVLADVGINESTFPDEAFRNYVSTVFDQDGDGIITDDEIAGITGIDAIGLGIESLKGIEYFTALEYLTCDGNNITEIDLSGNPNFIGLAASNNQIQSLNVSNNPKLYQMWVNNNQLTALDVSHNSELAIAYFQNNFLRELDISSNPNLRELDFDNNRFFDMEGVHQLEVDGNRIRNIDLSNAPLLEHFCCCANEVTALDFSNNPLLTYINCGFNFESLSSINVSGQTKLQTLFCSGNNLTARCQQQQRA